MRCQWLKKRFLNGQPPGDTPEIEEHLRGCPDCHQEQKSWQEVDSLLLQMPSFDPPPEMLSVIMTEIERRQVTRPLSLSVRWSVWRAKTVNRLEKVLCSEIWNPVINLTTSFAVVMLFFTEWSRFSVVNQLLCLSRSQGFRDILWSVKVGAVGFYYNFLTYWIN